MTHAQRQSKPVKSKAKTETSPLRGPERDFVEAVALFYEQQGLPRTAGLVLAYFMVCDPPHQTAVAIQRAVEVSAGSVSSCLRSLESMEFIGRTPVAGARARFYQINEGVWELSLHRQVQAFARAAALVARGKALFDQPDPRAVRFEAMERYYDFMKRETELMLERWEEARRGP